MKQRVITAVIALIIFIPILILGGVYVDVAALFLGIVAISEILVMKKKLLISPEAIISYIGTSVLILPKFWQSFLPASISTHFLFFLAVIALLVLTVLTKNIFTFDDVGTLTLGMMYIGFGFNYFIDARAEGLQVLLFALFIVWITDSGAYIFGRQFGKHKLAPHVSPNKTIEGSVLGTVSAIVLVSIFVNFYPVSDHSLVTMVPIIAFLSIAGQFGDLIESALKRYFGVKDSGRILPGHGGILDRFDSLLLVLPMLHLVGII
ncbi:phosphatidate cytidylyltransferase [Lentilactobacillus sp. Marseille-Q4993]|uniref:phosphatidate cytidylyltransferase n=1 Tax=Lentilactobacillus sp. Marseille-Q4993 TaxID=3039492 RepID=UPI0024BCA6B7|nr:phosphatidate cytidylyltransferase [Lentilactobacillus sp. Marseille-Q4993]